MITRFVLPATMFIVIAAVALLVFGITKKKIAFVLISAALIILLLGGWYALTLFITSM